MVLPQTTFLNLVVWYGIAIRTCMQKIFSGKHTAKPPNFPAIPYHLVRIMATIDDPLIEVVGDDSRHNDSEQIQKEPRV